MDSKTFLQERSPRWKRLESLLEQVDRSGWRSVDAARIDEFGRLYQATIADLAQARNLPHAERTAAYLNALVARAYARIYRPRPIHLLRLIRLYAADFPRLFRMRLGLFLVAGGVLLAGVLAGFLAELSASGLARATLSPEQLRAIEDGFESQRVGSEWKVSIRPIVASRITANNIQVAFLAFVLGVTFGAGTVYVLFLNGLMLGCLASLFHDHGQSLAFWALILPHGVTELAAIVIAGQAGLLMGVAFADPGRLPRTTALVRGARDALILVVGTIPLFVVAGLIEGFVTPADFAPWSKLGFSALTVLPLAAYLGLAGRAVPGAVESARRRAERRRWRRE